MESCRKIVDGKEVCISNVVFIQDELTDKKESTVMVVEPDDGEDFLTGDVLFEAKFEDPDDADAFYELMQKAELTSI